MSKFLRFLTASFFVASIFVSRVAALPQAFDADADAQLNATTIAVADDGTVGELAVPSPPHFVVYADAWDGKAGPPAVSQVKVSSFSQKDGYMRHFLSMISVIADYNIVYRDTTYSVSTSLTSNKSEANLRTF